MREKYTVENIYEDDFGCEERAEGYEPQVIVILRDTKGNERTIKQLDNWMYQQEINEGDEVFLVDQRLHKIWIDS